MREIYTKIFTRGSPPSFSILSQCRLPSSQIENFSICIAALKNSDEFFNLIFSKKCGKMTRFVSEKLKKNSLALPDAWKSKK